MEDEERYERLGVCLEALRLENDRIPVLVEGMRDLQALRKLGLEGTIVVYNGGRGLGVFADDLARKHKRVIVLFDWDRTGGHLVKRLTEHIHTQVELDLTYRRELAMVSKVRSVEDVPGSYAYLRDTLQPPRGNREL